MSSLKRFPSCKAARQWRTHRACGLQLVVLNQTSSKLDRFGLSGLACTWSCPTVSTAACNVFADALPQLQKGSVDICSRLSGLLVLASELLAFLLLQLTFLFFSCSLCRAPCSLTGSPCRRLGSADFLMFRCLIISFWWLKKFLLAFWGLAFSLGILLVGYWKK